MKRYLLSFTASAFVALIGITLFTNAQVGIGTNTPNNTAALDVTSQIKDC